MVKFLRTEIGERVEQRDLQHATDDSQRNVAQQVPANILIGENAATGVPQPSNFVLSGFPVSKTGTVVKVTRGAAMLGVRERGVVELGNILVGGDADRSEDITSYSDGDYFVYVKFDFRDADYENRVFWNAGAATPVENSRNIATRREENWSMAIEATSPGAEWLLLAKVNKSGATLTLTDMRDFFFEGKVDTAYDISAEWGTADDRNTDRKTFGVFGFYRWMRAMQAQVRSMIGGGGWYRAIDGVASGGSGPRSLIELNAEKLGLDGSQAMTGSLVATGYSVTGDTIVANTVFSGPYLSASYVSASHATTPYRFSATRTFYRWAGVSAMVWDHEGADASTYVVREIPAGSFGPSLEIESPTASIIRIDVDIPEGAIFHSIELYFLQKSANQVVVNCNRIKNSDGTVNALLASSFTSNATVDTLQSETIAWDAGALRTISNFTYHYYIKIDTVSGAAGKVLLYGARVAYQADEVRM